MKWRLYFEYLPGIAVPPFCRIYAGGTFMLIVLNPENMQKYLVVFN